MKCALNLLLLLPLFCGAQEIVLLDRRFKEPIRVSGPVTGEALNRSFPVYRSDLDSVIQITESLLSSLHSGKPPKENTRFVQAGHSLFAIRTWNVGAHSTHFVVLSTRSGNKGATLALVTEKDGTKKAARKLLVFLDYLKNNRPVLPAERLP
jgi:hypothetical protein